MLSFHEDTQYLMTYRDAFNKSSTQLFNVPRDVASCGDEMRHLMYSDNILCLRGVNKKFVDCLYTIKTPFKDTSMKN